MWYGYKASLNGHEDIVIGLGGAPVAGWRTSGNSGGTTIIGKNFITAAGRRGRNYSNLSDGGVGGNFGLATDDHPGFAKGGNGHAGTEGIKGKSSGNGGDAGGDTSRGGDGGLGQGSYASGKAGRGFGGGGAGAHADRYYSGAEADGAVLIRLWKE
ncbi:hypothetical protein LNM86_01705 [Bartonella machadoae]|nr:hypothetical protein [Bartonella machadoae]UNE54635.1 hypothetical protein LNM86_01705 [Bartonella machadoae]